MSVDNERLHQTMDNYYITLQLSITGILPHTHCALRPYCTSYVAALKQNVNWRVNGLWYNQAVWKLVSRCGYAAHNSLWASLMLAGSWSLRTNHGRINRLHQVRLHVLYVYFEWRDVIRFVSLCLYFDMTFLGRGERARPLSIVEMSSVCVSTSLDGGRGLGHSP